MADVQIGRGVIELVADARKLRAGIEEAKRQVGGLGEGQTKASQRASQAIDRYIGKLQAQNATFGKTRRETELFNLALKGASDSQLKAANAALLIADRNKRMADSFDSIRASAIRAGAVIGTVIVASATAAVVAFEKLVGSAAQLQDLAEQLGETGSALSSLQRAAAIGGKSIDEVAQFAVKLNKNLTGVDDDSEKAGAALKAIGIDIAQFKTLQATEQIRALATALDQFSNVGTGKTDVLEALARGGSQLLPTLKELARETERFTGLTDEQIAAADDYKDRQAALRAELGLYAQAIAIEALPAINDLLGAFTDVIKETLGVKEGVGELRDNQAIQDFARSAVRAIALVIDSLTAITRAFEIAGRVIYGFGATAARALSLDFKTAAAEITSTVQAVEEIRKRPSLVAVLDKRFAATDAAKNAPKPPPEAPKPKIDFRGAKKEDKSAEQEAQAQLQFQLEQIKRAGDSAVAEFDRSERILEAKRAANLIDDRDYYEAKRAFVQLNLQAQEQALRQEIALLQQQTFTGKNAAKDRIDNDRKIAEAEARLSKAQADAVTERVILDVKEEDANRKKVQSYLDAVDAVNAYIDSIQRRNAAEIAGIGRGNKFREDQAAQLQAEQRFLQERNKLLGELRRGQITRDVFETYLQLAADAYRQEVELYQERSAAISDAESRWLNGATEALANYADEARNVAKQTEDIFTNAFKGAEDALTKFLDTGKLDLKGFLTSIASDLNRAFVRQNILGPLAEQLKDSDLLKNLGPLIGLGSAGAAESKKVVNGIAGPIDLSKLTESGATAGAALEASLATASATFSAEVSTAGATFTPEVTAAAAAFGTEVTAAGATFTPEIAAAGATFASTVTAAGAEFAASVSAAGASGGGGAGDLLGAGFSALGGDSLGSFATGTPYVPQTGLYQLHQGERVVPAAENAAMSARPVTIVQQFAPGTTRELVDRAAVRAGVEVQRQMARGTAA